MLAHQMAAIHGATMRMTERLNRCIERMAPEKYGSEDGEARREGANVLNVNEGGQALVAGQVGGPQRGLEGSSK